VGAKDPIPLRARISVGLNYRAMMPSLAEAIDIL
jgi:hypothetical protein